MKKTKFLESINIKNILSISPSYIAILTLLLLFSNFIFNVGYFYNIGWENLTLLSISDYFEGTVPYIIISFIILISTIGVTVHRFYVLSKIQKINHSILLIIITLIFIFPMSHFLFYCFWGLTSCYILFNWLINKKTKLHYYIGLSVFYILSILYLGFLVFHYNSNCVFKLNKMLIKPNFSNEKYYMIRPISRGIFCKNNNKILFIPWSEVGYLEKINYLDSVNNGFSLGFSQNGWELKRKKVSSSHVKFILFGKTIIDIK